MMMPARRYRTPAEERTDPMTDDQPTCGKGLAANAKLPATVGDLLSAMSDVLDRHQQALDPGDEHTRPERDAYATLVKELRALSAQLTATASRMTGYRDLPMGRHDEQKMSGEDALAAFERFVGNERALLLLLTESVHQHEAMLEQWHSS
jgi:hypothetical protein